MNIEMYRIFFEIQKKHWWFDTKRNIVLDTILRCTNLHNNDAILDIGCGSGLMLNTLEKVGNTYGMDISKEAIQFSSEIFSGPVKQGSLPNAIPYPKDYFSLITALDVIEHIDDDLGSLKTIRELLKNDGKAVINQITLGGEQGNDAAIGKVIGPSFYADEIPDVMGNIINTYVAQRVDDESFIQTYKRLGVAPFKEAAYKNAKRKEKAGNMVGEDAS